MDKELIIRQNTDKLKAFVGAKFENGDLDNESLVQLIIQQGALLNLETIPAYCRRTGMTYNGVKHHRNVVELFGVKYVIDNE